MKKELTDIHNIPTEELEKHVRYKLAKDIMLAVLPNAIKDVEVTPYSIASFSFKLADEFIRQSKK